MLSSPATSFLAAYGPTALPLLVELAAAVLVGVVALGRRPLLRRAAVARRARPRPGSGAPDSRARR